MTLGLGLTSPLSAQPVIFHADAGLIVYTVPADRTEVFERLVGRLADALSRGITKERQQQAAGWRIFRASEPTADGSVVYVSFCEPAIQGIDYSVEQILSEAFPHEATDLIRSFRFAIEPAGLTQMSLGVIRDLTPAGLTRQKVEAEIAERRAKADEARARIQAMIDDDRRRQSEPEPVTWDVSNFSFRVTEANETYVRLAWKLDLRNIGQGPIALDLAIEFQDKDGFVIDTGREYDIRLAAGNRQSLTGDTLVRTAGAIMIAKALPKVTRRR